MLLENSDMAICSLVSHSDVHKAHLSKISVSVIMPAALPYGGISALVVCLTPIFSLGSNGPPCFLR